MIRVAFALQEDESWMGGVNYLKNLLYAVSTFGDRIEPLLFMGNASTERTIRLFEPYARIFQHAIFDKKSIPWYLRKFGLKLIGSDRMCAALLSKKGVQVASHCSISGSDFPFKTINWIPDFQHLHLPELFSAREISERNRKYRKRIEESDRMVVSSHAALADLVAFAPEFAHKARVLHFVSQPTSAMYELGRREKVEQQYGVTGRFFYLPNQLWRHKNHQTVFEAIDILKRSGVDIRLVCTGNSVGMTGDLHSAQLLSFMSDRGLEENIRILGLVDYEDVLYFMRHSVSVINPSLFEGWSSTVEEAKSIGKNMILSDIPVHREQNPPDTVYFAPLNAEQLAKRLSERWRERIGGPDFELEKVARNGLEQRTRDFASTYQNVVLEASGRN
ncbi:MAG: glycosyltransferase family 4 protein [Desulfuromonadaceae bacterium]